MSYTGETPICGNGTVSAAAIDAWYAAKGPAAAAVYAPDGQYKPAPAGLGQMVIEESRRWAPYTVNHDLIAGDIAHESAYWQSEIARDKNNPSGLGATNDDPYGGAVWFATPNEGVRATVAHMLSYAVGEGPWTQSDPRYEAVKDAGWLGVAPRLMDLNGRWAYPGTNYGQQVASVSNDLVAFAASGSFGDDSRFLWKPDTLEYGYPGGTHGRSGCQVELGIIHYTAGTDSSGWLLGGNGSSTHYLTWGDMTPREQHVAEADAAWTAGNRDFNLRGVNVEGELPGNYWTRELIAELARTTAPIWQRNNIPFEYLGFAPAPGRRGLIGHVDVPNQDHPDPGSTFEWPFYLDQLNLAASGSVPPPQEWYCEATGYTVGGGFYQFWLKYGGIAIFGYPITAEYEDPDLGCVVQYFERARFEWRPDIGKPEDWDVVLGLLGSEACATMLAA